jgi:site-specific DNA-methyltransferase (adenine-specific)
MNIKACLTSQRQNWKTPKMFYKALDAEFDFDLDPCPPNPKIDGLSIDWGSCNFVNPPYNKIILWVKKAYEEWKKGKTVVLLIPSRTDTRWWHDYVMSATEIRFIKGRLCFDDSKHNAPFPSCLVIFKSQTPTTKAAV